MQWSKNQIQEQLLSISQKGFIGLEGIDCRRDDGIVGQILEREFGVQENNLNIADLGAFELKGMRKRKNANVLTLFHKKSSRGMTPIELFDRFGYIKQSTRSTTMKKKLFTTIKGDRINNLGFHLRADGEMAIDLYCDNEYLSTWDLTEAKSKINQVILVMAKTEGVLNSADERFHYIEAHLLYGLKSISEAISAGAVVLDLCIDQPADQSKGIHDRGPHIRIPIRKLGTLFSHTERLL